MSTGPANLEIITLQEFDPEVLYLAGAVIVRAEKNANPVAVGPFKQTADAISVARAFASEDHNAHFLVMPVLGMTALKEPQQ